MVNKPHLHLVTQNAASMLNVILSYPSRAPYDKERRHKNLTDDCLTRRAVWPIAKGSAGNSWEEWPVGASQEGSVGWSLCKAK